MKSYNPQKLFFDPQTDYANLDLDIFENLVCWYFGELVKTLITLSVPAVRQIEIIGNNYAVADEMAEDYYRFFNDYKEHYKDYCLISEEQFVALTKLEDIFDEKSRPDYDFWNDFKLHTNPDWVIVRRMANEILKSLGFDHLDIEFKKSLAYNDEGVLIGEVTKTLLVEKKIYKSK